MQTGPTLLTAEQAVTTILNNIQLNGALRPWLLEYAQRNAITIQSLIENDTFGPLSDFDAENPAPSAIEQARILKAFLTYSEYAVYDVLAITGLLNDFTKNIEQQARSLDNILMTAQLHREEVWGTQLPQSISIQLNALNTIQIFNQMERMLNALENSEDKANLKVWVARQRTQIANTPYSKVGQSEIVYLLFGASQLSKFIRNETNRLTQFFNRTYNRIMSISDFNLTRSSLVGLLLDGLLFSINLGLTCLLPYRLALTLAREVRYLVNSSLRYLSEAFLPQAIRPATNLIASIAGLGILYYLFGYLQLSWGMILGVQLFPETWSWSFIGSIALKFSVTELGLGLTLGLAKKCYAYSQQRCENNVEPIEPPSVDFSLQLDNHPAPESLPTALNPEQKQQLLRLLVPERGNLNTNESMAADKKQKKSDKITTEITTLMTAEPYFLSKFDKKLLARQDGLPEVFNNLESEVQPFRLHP
jgi:hypothetical protein